MRKILAGFSLILVLSFIGILFASIELRRVLSNSMYPNYKENDVLLTLKSNFFTNHTNLFSVNYGTPIIFNSQLSPWSSELKRVVGLPGDTVELTDGNVIINKIVLRKIAQNVISVSNSIDSSHKLFLEYPLKGSPYLVNEDNPQRLPTGNVTSTVVPPESVYVLSDNRYSGIDSRLYYKTSISFRDIDAKVIVVLFNSDIVRDYFD